MKPFSLEEYLANPTRKVVTRDGRKAIYQNGDDELHHLFLSSCDILVDSYGYINCKELPSGLDIVSEWQEEISEEEQDRLATDAYIHSTFNNKNEWDKAVYYTGYLEGLRKALEYINSNKK